MTGDEAALLAWAGRMRERLRKAEATVERSAVRASVLGTRNDMGASSAPRMPVPDACDAIVVKRRSGRGWRAWLKSDPSFWAEGATARRALDLLRQTHRPRLDGLDVEGE